MTDDKGIGGGKGSDDYPGTPRWVKAFGIVVVALVLAAALTVLSGVRLLVRARKTTAHAA